MMNSEPKKIDKKYVAALNYLLNKFKSYSEVFDKKKENNPIEFVNGRIKKMNSIEEKRVRKNNGKEIKDIVGVRIVCPCLNDVYEMIQYINEDKDLAVIETKDYIKYPKVDSNYRSYHMIVKVPVVINEKIEYVVSEIQIRTLVMDLHASLDHKCGYKKSDEKSKKTNEAFKQFTNFCLLDEQFNILINRLKKKGIPENKTPSIELSDEDYKIFISEYEEALRYLQNKVENLSAIFEENGITNPIEHIKTRIKEKDKMLLKIEEKNPNIRVFNAEMVENSIHDIAGIRIVCSFLSDIPKIIKILKSDSDLNFIEEKEKDYITNPKKNGYRGHHLVVSVGAGTSKKKVEIVIQTSAMALWDSFHHKLCYKKKENEELQLILKGVANDLHEVDETMNQIYLESIEEPSKTITEDENSIYLQSETNRTNIKRRVLVPPKN